MKQTKKTLNDLITPLYTLTSEFAIAKARLADKVDRQTVASFSRIDDSIVKLFTIIEELRNQNLKR